MASEEKSIRRIVAVAAIAGALGVIFGAFGSHLLESYLRETALEDSLIERRIDQFEISARYHLVHSVALLALGALPLGSIRGRGAVAILFVVGLVLFSGSLYLLVLTNTTWLGAVTPLGGLAWIAGWLWLAVVALRK